MIISHTNEVTKMSTARKIYAEMATAEQTYTRKDVLARFQSEAGMTKRSAESAYFHITKKAKTTAAA
jgi:hypothetical protein